MDSAESPIKPKEENTQTLNGREKLESIYLAETYSTVALVKFGAVYPEERVMEFPLIGTMTPKIVLPQINLNKAEEILNVRAQSLDKLEMTSVPIHPYNRAIESMINILPNSFRKVVKRLVDNRIITPRLAYWVGRVSRPSSVILGEEMSYAWSIPNTENLSLPEIDGERESIIIGDKLIHSTNNQIASAIERAGGAKLTEEELTDISTQTIIAHEYTHKALGVLETLYATQNGKPENDDVYYERAKEIKVHAASIAPDEVLNRLIGNVPQNTRSHIEQQIIEERICAGIEKYTLLTLLRQKGVSEKSIDEVITSRFGRETEEWKFLEEFCNAARDAGLNFSMAEIGIRQIRSKLVGKEIRRLVPTSDLSYFFSRITPVDPSVLKILEDKVKIPAVPRL